MATNASFAEIAALAGDPARASMMHALMDGRALTASELARAAAITPQTASGHLARLVTAGLLAVSQQGRHRYHRLASPSVARMMESIMQVASETTTRKPVVVGPRDQALRAARTCYDHLAGRLGVALADAMIEGGHVELASDAGALTDSGVALLTGLGIDLQALSAAKRSQRLFCRPCIDWSERRPHLAGAVGAALCAQCFAKGWIRRAEGTRAVTVTPKGRFGLRETFGVMLA
ncbi:MAG: helix-turn-helix transcriptional regulator [Alphaproteobacteria bacterium]|nr:helix-turn-helix transcriptional regulator [Alphaproteobacteria bacterium]